MRFWGSLSAETQVLSPVWRFRVESTNNARQFLSWVGAESTPQPAQLRNRQFTSIQHNTTQHNMRLINSLTYELHEFTSDDAIPSFAILSHTWGAEECTFQQMSERNVASRQGFAKIKLCCEQARQDGYDWAWIDT